MQGRGQFLRNNILVHGIQYGYIDIRFYSKRQTGGKIQNNNIFTLKSMYQEIFVIRFHSWTNDRLAPYYIQVMIGYPKYYILRFVASWSLLLLIFANFFGGSILISAALLTIFQSLRLSNSTMAKKKRKTHFFMAIQKPKFQILDNPLLVNMEFPK